MDGDTYSSYFLQPEVLAHRRYEALRAVCGAIVAGSGPAFRRQLWDSSQLVQ